MPSPPTGARTGTSASIAITARDTTQQASRLGRHPAENYVRDSCGDGSRDEPVCAAACTFRRMRIGLNGGGGTVERMIEQAQQAEADGFSALWYPSAVAGDPVTPMAAVGRETSTIELGTAVLQTYTAHPLLQAKRAAAAAWTMGRPGFTLGIGRRTPR